MNQVVERALELLLKIDSPELILAWSAYLVLVGCCFVFVAIRRIK